MKKAVFLALFLLGTVALQATQKPMHLEIGDGDRKDREIPVTLDAVTDTRTGELLTASELAARLDGVQLVFFGESHTSVEFHEAQLRVLEELHRAGRHVVIGLEMYPYTHQEYLDEWVAGRYTEEGFLHFSKWYESWTHNWLYYRDIFLFARGAGVPMYAVNAPRDVVTAVRKKGFQDLTEEEAAHIPTEIDTTSEEHRQLFRSFFDEDDPLHSEMSEEAWDGMVRAQATWDATMGWNSVKALKASDDPQAIMVVLIGSGHVAYGLGIERQAAQWFDGEMASVIPVPITDDDNEPIETVRASYADFIWGVPSPIDSLYPVLGTSTRAVDGERASGATDDGRREVIYVAESSPAEAGGFEVGDVILTMDGVEVVGKGVIGRLMAGKRWGDPVRFVVRRGEEDVDLSFHFRRQRPDEDEDEEDEEDDDE